MEVVKVERVQCCQHAPVQASVYWHHWLSFWSRHGSWRVWHAARGDLVCPDGRSLVKSCLAHVTLQVVLEPCTSSGTYHQQMTNLFVRIHRHGIQHLHTNHNWFHPATLLTLHSNLTWHNFYIWYSVITSNRCMTVQSSLQKSAACK